MSSEDDIDDFNDLVNKNKEKLKQKYIDKSDIKNIDIGMDSFIVDSESDNETNSFVIDSASEIFSQDSSSNDCDLLLLTEIDNENVEKTSKHVVSPFYILDKTNSKCPQVDSQNSVENIIPNKEPKKENFDESDDLFSEISFSSLDDYSDFSPMRINTMDKTEVVQEMLFKTPVNKHLNSSEMSLNFKTPKMQINKLDKIFAADRSKSLLKESERSILPEGNKENSYSTSRNKKIDLSVLIKTCETKDKILPKKFSRLTVESDSDSSELSDGDDSFIDDSNLLSGSELGISDEDLSDDASSDSDIDRDKWKSFVTPKQKIVPQKSQTMPVKCHQEKLDFISSLLDNVDNDQRDPEAITYRLKYKSLKSQLAEKIYQIYNEKAFDNLMPEHIQIEWKVTLRKTAGQCMLIRSKKNNQITHSIIIKLATKVLTDAERLLRTMVHEMCHGAVWMIDMVHGHHGPLWKKWTMKAHQAFPSVIVSKRCHNYKIHYKFEYKCQNCNFVYRRHSKSIDINKKKCHRCYGNLALFRIDQKGSQKAVDDQNKKLNVFSQFVKENYNKYRMAGTSHAEVMKKLSELYKTTNKPRKDEDLCSLMESINLVGKL